jgi:uncharacterized iron-regulated membrane protein
LWWRRRSRTRAVRSLLLPDLAAKKGVRRTRGWHATTGVWLAVGMLFLAATGLTWSRHAGANFSEGLDLLRGSRPELSTALAAGAPSTGGGHHGDAGTATGTAAADPAALDPAALDPAALDPAAADTVLRTAREAGLSGPVEIAPAEDATSAWTVTQTDSTWPVRKDAAAVDPATGTVVSRVDFADWPMLAKLSTLGIDAHMGVLFGAANQILLATLAIGLLCVILWGYRMWWQRRPTRADRRAPVGAPPVARGAWHRLPTWGIVVGLPLTFLTGWVLPVFGVTLLAFLVIDALLGTLRSRRPTRPTPVAPAPTA